MKEYLVDVPVKINIWIRPEFQVKQFDVIKKARPSILFIQSDGGRNKKEREIIQQNRDYIDKNIDWNCKVYRLYENNNNGLYAMAQKMNNLIWSNVDRCIFTEDDQIPSISFFRFCAELLEKYKNDTRVECICGVNQEGISKNVSSDYFFSKQGSIWGIATWKRVAELHSCFDYKDDIYIQKLLKYRTRRNKYAWKRIVGYGNKKYYNGHVAGTEFWIDFDMYAQNMVQIIPKKNLISNIGTGDNAEHSSKIEYIHPRIRNVFNAPTYELSFPLRHPKYMIPDHDYEKYRNRIHAYGSKVRKYEYALYSFFSALFHFDIKYISSKIKRRIIARNNISEK